MSTKLELPGMCYAPHPNDGHCIVIVKGQDGYREPAKQSDAEGLDRREDILNLNARQLYVCERQMEAMLAASMFGWYIPAADPNHKMYDKYETLPPRADAALEASR